MFNLRKILLRCVCTVRGEIVSRTAISSSLNPCPISDRIARSHSLSTFVNDRGSIRRASFAC